MSATTSASPAPPATADLRHDGQSDTCGVNIRGVPRAVWRRARQNALLSGLPFKTYVIRLLEQSQPLPPPSSPAAPA